MHSIQRTVAKLVLLAVAMFVFALGVMPPLYTLFCEVTGLNGKTGGKYTAVPAAIDTSRWITVRFIGINNENMPWGFKPRQYSIKVHPGESVSTEFLAKNPTTYAMVGQAVPSLVPHNATDYFHKMECFCFNSQVLGPGESAELGLQFFVDQAIPKGITTITLSYTLFDITGQSENRIEEKINS